MGSDGKISGASTGEEKEVTSPMKVSDDLIPPSDAGKKDAKKNLLPPVGPLT